MFWREKLELGLNYLATSNNGFHFSFNKIYDTTVTTKISVDQVHSKVIVLLEVNLCKKTFIALDGVFSTPSAITAFAF